MSIITYGYGPSGGGTFEPGAVRMSNIKDGDLMVEILSVNLEEKTLESNLVKEELDAAIILPVLNAEGESPKK